MEPILIDIKPSVINNLCEAPSHLPISLLMRHSARFPIEDMRRAYSVGLTPQGVAMAETFGQFLSRSFSPGRLRSAPVGRCRDTALAIGRGANWRIPVEDELRVSFPYIEQAYETRNEYIPGTKLPIQIIELMNALLENQNQPPCVDIVVTHDSILTCLLKYLLGFQFSADNWPQYLEGLLVWKENSRIMILWRSERFEVDLSLAQ